jgi:hypothetical protein
MIRDEAARQVQTYVELPEGSILFEYLPAVQTLKASALVFRFALPPSDRLRQALAAAGDTADTAGGRVDYLADGLCLCLSRSYAAPVDPDLFAAQINALYDASRAWEAETLPACEAAVGE